MEDYGYTISGRELDANVSLLAAMKDYMPPSSAGGGGGWERKRKCCP